MAHLASFRRGWENENLARFLLSKFSFIANPSTISDDIGSDYFCTLFNVIKKDSHKYLMPKNSFAIQIKSNVENFDITNKIGYLANLEVPYFIGIIDRDKLELSIYSGEFFPQFISHKTPNNLCVELCDRNRITNYDYFTENEDRKFVLRFPKVAVINAKIKPTELQKIVDELCGICSLIQGNISSRKNCEYIFHQYNSRTVKIIAGRDSANTFRENFLKRLAENFFNLKWILENNPKEFDIQEYRIYENLLSDIQKLKFDVPDYVTTPYEWLREALKSKKYNKSL